MPKTTENVLSLFGSFRKIVPLVVSSSLRWTIQGNDCNPGIEFSILGSGHERI